ncbi:arylsulfatase [Pelagicoccus mobilis]|uniref:Arylsulfatase n=1 Tax=Pelagicoccus mobilis TaxID=415221 RepID=A0A934S6G6_9BACT|nr:arylsulfatase [Pelagicoccus mobilis]MBK1879813.1 arylsulfatase [Pelagicoccus mobilis]
MTRLLLTALLSLLAAYSSLLHAAAAGKQPNVILILTDDQGIGDIGCHGNPWLKTPHLDTFYEESIRLTDFHVSPLCTPTRAAIMTGRYPINNGTWATFKGRDALLEGTKTMADLFKKNGYTTGLFGKWHLGDNYPVRPTDSGFDVAVHHLAGGVGELSDYWGNSYFDDVYYVNNEAKQFEGYCTDVFFEEAMKFIKKNKNKPFFAYIPTNAPHDPLIVAEKYAAPYRHLEGDKIISAELYGMIANIDENFGKFRTFLKKEKLENNTILIFMSDNGSRFGYAPDGSLGFNAGFRGIKGNNLEGGHRVPFFIQWPDGKIEGGKDIEELAAHVDLLPTLAKLCGFAVPQEMPIDGVDVSSLLLQENAKLPKRTVFLHNNQDWRPPHETQGSAVMSGDWRLINGQKLFDIRQDPMQKKDLAAQYPELVKQLRRENRQFVQASKQNPEYKELPVNVIGNPAQHEIKLTIQHAIGEGGGIWKPEQVSAGMKNSNNKHALRIDRAGEYVIELRRWPKECTGPILGVPEKNPKDLYDYQTINPDKARIQIANQILESEIGPHDEAVVFRVRLETGKTILTNDFIEGKKQYGVYYTYIRPAKNP